MNWKSIALVSVAANAALLCLVLRQQPVAPAAPHVSKTPAVGAVVTNEVAVREFVGERFDWQRVESEDYRQYIRNLRGIGCPELTVRDIIIADVDKLFEQRRLELVQRNGGYRFWQTGRGVHMRPYSDEVSSKLTAMAEERRALLKELLGLPDADIPDLFASLKINPMERALDYLPAEKRARILELKTQLQERLQRISSSDAKNGEEAKLMNEMRKESEATIASLLTPEEFEQYQLRTSPTAGNMRFQLDGFDPTEEEFRQIFKYRKVFDDEFGGYGTGTVSAEEMERRGALQERIDAQIAASLTPERLADYQRAMDPAYQSLARLSDRNNLPKETARKVWDMMLSAQKASRTVNGNDSLSAEQRQAALAAIRSEAEQAISAAMGPTAFQSYTSTSAGWLQSISPK